MNQQDASIKTLGVLLFPEFETLDVFGPLQIFGMLPDSLRIVLISEHPQLVKSAQGQSIAVDFTLENAPALNFLLVPGGMGTRKEVHNPKLINWIKTQAATTEICLSVCTGAALLAKAGVLDGKKATSNKIAFDWVKQQSSKVDWINKARWVDEGSVITSSGVSAGIDMSLYLVSRLFGEKTSKELAKRIEYNPILDASMDPFAVS